MRVRRTQVRETGEHIGHETLDARKHVEHEALKA